MCEKLTIFSKLFLGYEQKHGIIFEVTQTVRWMVQRKIALYKTDDLVWISKYDDQ